MEKTFWVDETLGTNGTPTEIQAAKEEKTVVPETAACKRQSVHVTMILTFFSASQVW